jgi:hypothetical protein
VLNAAELECSWKDMHEALAQHVTRFSNEIRPLSVSLDDIKHDEDLLKNDAISIIGSFIDGGRKLSDSFKSDDEM